MEDITQEGLADVGRFFKKIGVSIASVPGKIDAKVNSEIAEKTTVATTAAVQTLDQLLPLLVQLLEGGKLKLEVTLKLSAE